MKRLNVSLEQIAEYKNVLCAFQKAAKGKRFRQDIQVFMLDFDRNITKLAVDIVNGKLPYGNFRTFVIHDPKKRLIHAACFEDRIFHHALMNRAGERFERAMMSCSYACRPNLGVHKAVKKVQQHLRQFSYFAKIDIEAYFTNIDHCLLLQILKKRFKGEACIKQMERVISSYETKPRCGLPIGALTSQYFANYYLDGLDRLLADCSQVRAQVRYMDDVIWWCDNKQDLKKSLNRVKKWLAEKRKLTFKNSVQLLKSNQGVSYCGYRITQGSIRLSRRKKRRYQKRRQYWEKHYLLGLINENQLQQVYASVEAITAGTDSKAWRKRNLQLHPPLAL